MRWQVLVLALLAAACASAPDAASDGIPAGVPAQTGEVVGMALKLSSPAFENEGSIPKKYTCDGENVNPPLGIEGVPDGAVSLVLLMDDPDVPTSIRPDGVWDHWVVFNIPPSDAEIAEGSAPEGVEGVNTGGELGYQGPCPPDREHRYFFRLYALDSELDLGEGVAKAEVEQAMQGHVVEEAELMGRYER